MVCFRFLRIGNEENNQDSLASERVRHKKQNNMARMPRPLPSVLRKKYYFFGEKTLASCAWAEEPCASFPDFCNTTSLVTTEKFLPRRLPR